MNAQIKIDEDFTINVKEERDGSTCRTVIRAGTQIENERNQATPRDEENNKTRFHKRPIKTEPTIRGPATIKQENCSFTQTNNKGETSNNMSNKDSGFNKQTDKIKISKHHFSYSINIKNERESEEIIVIEDDAMTFTNSSHRESSVIPVTNLNHKKHGETPKNSVQVNHGTLEIENVCSTTFRSSTSQTSIPLHSEEATINKDQCHQPLNCKSDAVSKIADLSSVKSNFQPEPKIRSEGPHKDTSQKSAIIRERRPSANNRHKDNLQSQYPEQGQDTQRAFVPNSRSELSSSYHKRKKGGMERFRSPAARNPKRFRKDHHPSKSKGEKRHLSCQKDRKIRRRPHLRIRNSNNLSSGNSSSQTFPSEDIQNIDSNLPVDRASSNFENLETTSSRGSNEQQATHTNILNFDFGRFGLSSAEPSHLKLQKSENSNLNIFPMCPPGVNIFSSVLNEQQNIASSLPIDKPSNSRVKRSNQKPTTNHAQNNFNSNRPQQRWQNVAPSARSSYASYRKREDSRTERIKIINVEVLNREINSFEIQTELKENHFSSSLSREEGQHKTTCEFGSKLLSKEGRQNLHYRSPRKNFNSNSRGNLNRSPIKRSAANHSYENHSAPRRLSNHSKSASSQSSSAFQRQRDSRTRLSSNVFMNKTRNDNRSTRQNIDSKLTDSEQPLFLSFLKEVDSSANSILLNQSSHESETTTQWSKERSEIIESRSTSSRSSCSGFQKQDIRNKTSNYNFTRRDTSRGNQYSTSRSEGDRNIDSTLTSDKSFYSSFQKDEARTIQSTAIDKSLNEDQPTVQLSKEGKQNIKSRSMSDSLQKQEVVNNSSNPTLNENHSTYQPKYRRNASSRPSVKFFQKQEGSKIASNVNPETNLLKDPNPNINSHIRFNVSCSTFQTQDLARTSIDKSVKDAPNKNHLAPRQPKDGQNLIRSRRQDQESPTSSRLSKGVKQNVNSHIRFDESSDFQAQEDLARTSIDKSVKDAPNKNRLAPCQPKDGQNLTRSRLQDQENPSSFRLPKDVKQHVNSHTRFDEPSNFQAQEDLTRTAIDKSSTKDAPKRNHFASCHSKDGQDFTRSRLQNRKRPTSFHVPKDVKQKINSHIRFDESSSSFQTQEDLARTSIDKTPIKHTPNGNRFASCPPKDRQKSPRSSNNLTSSPIGNLREEDRSFSHLSIDERQNIDSRLTAKVSSNVSIQNSSVPTPPQNGQQNNDELSVVANNQTEDRITSNTNEISTVLAQLMNAEDPAEQAKLSEILYNMLNDDDSNSEKIETESDATRKTDVIATNNTLRKESVSSPSSGYSSIEERLSSVDNASTTSGIKPVSNVDKITSLARLPKARNKTRKKCGSDESEAKEPSPRKKTASVSESLTCSGSRQTPKKRNSGSKRHKKESPNEMEVLQSNVNESLDASQLKVTTVGDLSEEQCNETYVSVCEFLSGMLNPELNASVPLPSPTLANILGQVCAIYNRSKSRGDTRK